MSGDKRRSDEVAKQIECLEDKHDKLSAQITRILAYGGAALIVVQFALNVWVVPALQRLLP